MNKISLTILVVAAMLMAFTGCKKDEPEPPTPPMSNNQGESTNTTNSGIYNPEKKISKIYSEGQYTEGKHLCETWTWNGNLLDKITYNKEGDITMFEYDGKRLKCVRYSSRVRCEFTYDGKKVKECNWYCDGKIDETYTFTHDGSKISKIEITEYDNDNKSMKSRKEHSLISYMMPGTKLAENVDRQLLTKATKGKGNYTRTVSFEWDGDNISKATYEAYDEDEYYNATYQYTYDKKSNPYYCLLIDIVYNEDWDCMSKNNVTKETYTNSSGSYEEETYTYTYDGKFPTEQKKEYEDGDYYITYYEYQ